MYSVLQHRAGGPLIIVDSTPFFKQNTFWKANVQLITNLAIISTIEDAKDLCQNVDNSCFELKVVKYDTLCVTHAIIM